METLTHTHTKPMLFLDLLNLYDNDPRFSKSAAGQTNKNRQSHSNRLRRFLNTKGLNPTIHDVDVEMMREMMQFYRERHKSYGQIRRYYKRAKNVLDYAKENKMLLYNVIEKFKVPVEEPEPKAIEENELEKIFRVACEEAEEEAVKDVMTLRFLTGMNPIDLGRYRIEKRTLNLGGQNKTVTVLTYNRGKNESPCIIPISESPYFDEVMRIHVKYNGKMPKIPFMKFSFWMRKIMEKAGVSNAHEISPKNLRSTFATWFHDRYCSDYLVMKAMGHRSIVTAGRSYVKPSQKRWEQEIMSLTA